MAPKVKNADSKMFVETLANSWLRQQNSSIHTVTEFPHLLQMTNNSVNQQHQLSCVVRLGGWSFQGFDLLLQ